MEREEVKTRDVNYRKRLHMKIEFLNEFKMTVNFIVIIFEKNLVQYKNTEKRALIAVNNI